MDASSLISMKFEALINNKNLKPGDKLPSESELMREFNLPRSLIRSEIQKLVGLGVLETFQGKGTFISSRKDDIFYNSIFKIFFNQLDDFDLKNLLELRLLIEPVIVAKAAENATPDDIEALENLLQIQIQKIGCEEAFIEEDFHFHREIGKLSKNVFMTKVYELILSMFKSFHIHFFRNFSSFEDVIANHEKILNLIKNKKSEIAEYETKIQLLNYLDVLETYKTNKSF